MSYQYTDKLAKRFNRLGVERMFRKNVARQYRGILIVKATQGKICLLDLGDAWILDEYRLNAAYHQRGKESWFINTTKEGKHFSLHRLLLNPPSDLVVEHLNGNGLDNRRDNLRIVRREEASRNKRRYTNNSSGIKGVCKYGPNWHCYINSPGGKRLTKTFSIRKYGDKARQLAILQREEWEEELGYLVRE